MGELAEDEIAKQGKNAFRSLEKKIVRRMVVDEGVRVDGRGPKDLRAVSADVQVLPKTHGSAIFQRGETQVLSVLALGSTRENQRIDTLDPVEEKYYMHHYNMPPYSTGEAGRVGSPKRREIGHGLLAERAIVPVLPSMDEWPYTMRVVSDILSSNGSTSMGSVCGSTLALMDGGVPIHAPVSGIAMGLIYENGKYTTLTDIQGVEDFYGDMDFKVAGPEGFVTALQLDTKLTGVPSEVLRDALLQAREARMTILEVMLDAIPEPRDEVAEGAPRVEIVHIPQDKIGDVIGPRGKIIKEITEETGATIDIEEEDGRGVVRIYANSRDVAQAAVDRVNAIANPTLPEVGERYNATVVKTVDFGAFVNLTPGIDGLLHISALSKMVGKRLDHAEEAVDVGDKVWVEVKDVLDGGRKFKLEYVGDPSAPSSSDETRVTTTPARATTGAAASAAAAATATAVVTVSVEAVTVAATAVVVAVTVVAATATTSPTATPRGSRAPARSGRATTAATAAAASGPGPARAAVRASATERRAPRTVIRPRRPSDTASARGGKVRPAPTCPTGRGSRPRGVPADDARQRRPGRDRGDAVGPLGSRGVLDRRGLA